jgi:hypothetical protein
MDIANPRRRCAHMMMRCFRTALSGTVLACAGCIVVPAPSPPQAVAAPPPPPVQNCREFQQTVTIGGQAQQAFGTTCQQADGTWKVSERPSNNAPALRAAYPYPNRPYYRPYFVVPVGPPGDDSDHK